MTAAPPAEVSNWPSNDQTDHSEAIGIALITEVRFAHERGALAETLAALPDVGVSVVQEAGTDPTNDVYVIRFEGGDLDEVEAVLGTDPTVERIEPMREFEDQRLFGIEFTPETMLLNPTVTRQDGFVLEARGTNVLEDAPGWHERWLLPDDETLRDIWQYARENGFQFETIEFSQHGQSDPDFEEMNVVTDHQREALVTALEGGYFAEPREMSLEELAERLDLSSTAAARRLRRGMKSLVGGHLIVEGSDP